MQTGKTLKDDIIFIIIGYLSKLGIIMPKSTVVADQVEVKLGKKNLPSYGDDVDVCVGSFLRRSPLTLHHSPFWILKVTSFLI